MVMLGIGWVDIAAFYYCSGCGDGQGDCQSARRLAAQYHFHFSCANGGSAGGLLPGRVDAKKDAVSDDTTPLLTLNNAERKLGGGAEAPTPHGRPET
jgi:hypothetical protein